MRLSDIEKRDFHECIRELLEHREVNKMKKFIQHGSTDTFTHSYNVAYYSYWLGLRLGMKSDLFSIARGAMLHDFYLYDWHVPDESHRLHGFFHPAASLKNAQEHFDICHIQKEIIETHMWPLTIRKIPKKRESVIVCIVDKLCSVMETLGHKRFVGMAADC